MNSNPGLLGAGDSGRGPPWPRALSPLQEHGLQEEALGGRAGGALRSHVLLHVPSQVLGGQRERRPMASAAPGAFICIPPEVPGGPGYVLVTALNL